MRRYDRLSRFDYRDTKGDNRRLYRKHEDQQSSRITKGVNYDSSLGKNHAPSLAYPTERTTTSSNISKPTPSGRTGRSLDRDRTTVRVPVSSHDETRKPSTYSRTRTEY